MGVVRCCTASACSCHVASTDTPHDIRGRPWHGLEVSAVDSASQPPRANSAPTHVPRRAAHTSTPLAPRQHGTPPPPSFITIATPAPDSHLALDKLNSLLDIRLGLRVVLRHETGPNELVHRVVRLEVCEFLQCQYNATLAIYLQDELVLGELRVETLSCLDDARHFCGQLAASTQRKDVSVYAPVSSFWKSRDDVCSLACTAAILLSAILSVYG